MSLFQDPPPSSKIAKPLSVSELTQQIKNQLEMSYPTLSVQGEISNYKKHSSGHLYFSLKDEGAQIQVALFQASAQKLAFEPKDGDQVVLRGQISVYSQRGQYQIIARSMERVGMGEILLRLELLKNELRAKGWFDANRKKPLPDLPNCIGVVTSPTGSVIRDIIHVLSLRHSGFHLIIYPAKVQGFDAASEIAKGIRFFNKSKLCDLLIIARGGGSFEDLMSFNDMQVLQAVYESHVPTISAIGHETDFTLCDFVADFRAPTPSAAAEKAILAKRQLQERLDSLKHSITRRLIHQYQYFKESLRAIQRQKYLIDPHSLRYPLIQQLDEARSRLFLNIKHKLRNDSLKLLVTKQRLKPQLLEKNAQHWQYQIDQTKSQLYKSLNQLLVLCRGRLQNQTHEYLKIISSLVQTKKSSFNLLSHQLNSINFKNKITLKSTQLQRFKAVLEALSPQATLERGYAIVRKDSKQVVVKAANIAVGESLTIEFSDGTVKASINQV